MDPNITNLNISSRKSERSNSSCSIYEIYLNLIVLWTLYFVSIGLLIHKIIKSFKEGRIKSKTSSLAVRINESNILNEKPLTRSQYTL